MRIWKQIQKWVLDAFFPMFCIGCYKQGAFLCAKCPKQIEFLDASSRPLCAVSYKKEIVKRIIHNFKYERIKNLDHPIACLIRRFLKARKYSFSDDWIITSVPMHPFKQEIRGFNQSELIAKRLAESLGLKYQEILAKTQQTKAQMQLSKQDRIKNVVGVFELKKDRGAKNLILNRKIILIDDVCTTGSTLAECKRVLLAAGARRILCIAFAKD